MDKLHPWLPVGAPFKSGSLGHVPAPTAADVSDGKYLKADATWDLPAGGGGDYNIDGGHADTVYGASLTVDGGGA